VQGRRPAAQSCRCYQEIYVIDAVRDELTALTWTTEINSANLSRLRQHFAFRCLQQTLTRINERSLNKLLVRGRA
jgi:hypothetical protein